MRYRIDAAGTAVTVQVDTQQADIVEATAAIFALYPQPVSTPSLAYRIVAAKQFEIYRNGALFYSSPHPLDVVPALELDLFRAVIAPGSAGWFVHAALVELDGIAVAFAGSSGNGKSTITHALLQRGARYLTDECVVLRDDGTVRSLLRPLAFAATEPPKPMLQGARHYRYRMRADNEQIHTYALVLPTPEQLAPYPPRVDLLVAMRYLPGSSNTPIALSVAEALPALWPTTFVPSAAQFDTAIAWLTRTPVFALETDGINATCAAITNLIDERGRR